MAKVLLINGSPREHDNTFTALSEVAKTLITLKFAHMARELQAIDEATKRLLPYYAAKVPYMFDMVFSAPMPDAALQNIVKLF